MCMDPSPTGFYRMVQKVSDVIPIFNRITPRATEPSTVSVFLSVVKCSSVYIGHRPAHILALSHRLAEGSPT